MITVGQILKPQGIRGEVKVKAMTSDPSRFCVLKSVYIDGKPYKIKNARIGANEVYLTLDGVSDRNAAENLRGAMLQIDRAAAIDLEDGEFFVSDLIGATLFSLDGGEEKQIGKILRIDSFGAADVFTVECDDGRNMTFAFVKALSPRFDGQDRKLTVDGGKLREVAVYED